MTEIKLEAQLRDKNKEKPKQLLALGYLPAVVYGSGSKGKIIKIKEADFTKALGQAGETSLIDLSIGNDKPVKVVVHDMAINPVKDNVVHIDFYQVDMKKKITVNVPINYMGETKAVRELGGILIKNFDELEVECLPGNLINQVDVDLSVLQTFSDAIKAKDVKLPEGISLVASEDTTLASVIEPRIEEEPTEEEKEEGAEPTEEEKEEGAEPTGEEKKD